MTLIHQSGPCSPDLGPVTLMRDSPSTCYVHHDGAASLSYALPCGIKDGWSNRIVGFSIESRMKSRLAVNALCSVAARRGNIASCVLHTDRGSHRQPLPRRRHAGEGAPVDGPHQLRAG
jgi:transposase InsO family protein